MTDEEFKTYEKKYGKNNYSQLKVGNNNIHEPIYILQCIKYFIIPIKLLDQSMYNFYKIFQLLSFDSYILTSLGFLKFMFVFFLWGALETSFFSDFTDNILSATIDNPLPIKVNSNGSFSIGIGNASANINLTKVTDTVSGNIGHNLPELVISLFTLFIFMSFIFYIGIDLIAKFNDEYKSGSTWISLIIFGLKWGLFASFIYNFLFFVFLFAWFYLIIMTFFGYFFSTKSVKNNFFGDFFKNTYTNILQLDLDRYNLIKQLKETNVNNPNNEVINKIINNLSSYYSIQTNIFWAFNLTSKNPLLWSIIIFISLCLTTILIEIGQITSVSITFFVVNIILLIVLLIFIIIVYFGFNFLTNLSYNQKPPLIDKNDFQNLINTYISNSDPSISNTPKNVKTKLKQSVFSSVTDTIRTIFNLQPSQQPLQQQPLQQQPLQQQPLQQQPQQQQAQPLQQPSQQPL
jgi:hypothetical protein